MSPHRSSFDHDRLHGEYAYQNKYHHDQKDVAEEAQALDPYAALRFATRMDHVNAVIVHMVRIEADLFILAEIEHNRVSLDERVWQCSWLHNLR